MQWLKAEDIRVTIFSFTQKGSELSRRVKGLFQTPDIRLWMPGHFRADGERFGAEHAADALAEVFPTEDAIVFIGACGIAVRLISGFVQSKLTDPAVVVIDEQGQFVIPVLSGHLGGANRLAGELADWLHAIPVITTATDVNTVFAVDAFAREHDLAILPQEKPLIAALSGELLAGNAIGALDELDCGFLIGEDSTLAPFEKTLHLLPRRLIVGMGCRRGTEADKLWEFLRTVFEKNNLNYYQIYAIASITEKREEKGLIELARRLGSRFWTFDKCQLEVQKGNFHESDFVRQKMGVGNVCERAALAGAVKAGFVKAATRFEEIAVVSKTAENGMTIAVVSANKEEGRTF